MARVRCEPRRDSLPFGDRAPQTISFVSRCRRKRSSQLLLLSSEEPRTIAADLTVGSIDLALGHAKIVSKGGGQAQLGALGRVAAHTCIC